MAPVSKVAQSTPHLPTYFPENNKPKIMILVHKKREKSVDCDVMWCDWSGERGVNSEPFCYWAEWLRLSGAGTVGPERCDDGGAASGADSPSTSPASWGQSRAHPLHPLRYEVIIISSGQSGRSHIAWLKLVKLQTMLWKGHVHGN